MRAESQGRTFLLTTGILLLVGARTRIISDDNFKGLAKMIAGRI